MRSFEKPRRPWMPYRGYQNDDPAPIGQRRGPLATLAGRNLS